MARPANILGISAFYHDSAAALLAGGSVVAAAQEERFSRKKHDPRFPVNAIEWCLRGGGLKASDLDAVVFYEKPFLTFERLLLSYLSVAPKGLLSWLKGMPLWLSQKLHVRKKIQREIGFEGAVLFTEHHEAHAASAFYPSPFREAAILTIDGVGEWATASYGYGRNREIVLLKELQFPNSLGLLYSAFTLFTGFRVNSGEYKLMGLAPYGALFALLPVRMAPVHDLWHRIGNAVGQVVIYVAMTIVYFLVISPYALIMRALGRQPIPTGLDRSTQSYWVHREEPIQSRERMMKRF